MRVVVCASLREGGEEGVGGFLDISKKCGGGFLVFLVDGEVEVFEFFVEGFGLCGVCIFDFDEVVDVEAEGIDLAAKFVGCLGLVFFVDVFINIFVDVSL